MEDHGVGKKNNDKTEKPIETSMSLPSKLERNPSLDVEPKTLLPHELNLAREEALKIINTHTKEEALKIFLTGLVPVTSSKNAKEYDIVSDDDNQ